MKRVKLNAYGKLNLTLDILGKTGEYHEIDSLVTSVDLFDKIEVVKRRDSLVGVTMRGMGSELIPPEENSVQRAAELFVQTYKTTGVNVTVYKNIPMGAGMGGSSVDAAGTFLALSKLYETEKEELDSLAEQIGSDVPCLLHGGLMRMRGRGEQIFPVETDAKFYFLLLVPRSGVSTRECYQKSDELPQSVPTTESAYQKILAGDLEGAAKDFRNALYPAACALNPEVKTAYEELKAFSPWAVNMTGSGSGVYAIFETAELCAWAKSRYRGKFPSYLLKSKSNS